jgi:hypothetical protein
MTDLLQTHLRHFHFGASEHDHSDGREHGAYMTSFRNWFNERIRSGNSIGDARNLDPETLREQIRESQ